MRIQTPYKLHHLFYLGVDTKARSGDELLAAGIGRFYLGIYPTTTGFEVAYGILNSQGSL